MASGKAESLGSNLIVPSVASGLSIISGGYTKSGNIVIVNLKVKADETIATETRVVTNMPKPVVNDTLVEISSFGGDKSGYHDNRIFNSNIIIGQQLTGNVVYRIEGTYITKD